MSKLKQNRRLGRTGRFAGGAGLFVASGLVLVACGGRPSSWDEPVSYGATSLGLSGAVAIHDSTLDRVLFLSVPKDAALRTTAEPIGQNVSSFTASADGTRLLVLSRGALSRRLPEDEPPQLLVFDGSADPSASDRLQKRFTLDDPMKQLAIDPEGEWVVAFQSEATVTNANELVFCKLVGKGVDGTVVSKTIRSFGGVPTKLIFTSELAVPGGTPRRFLVLLTDRDAALIDLADLTASEITIPLPKDSNDRPYKPLDVAFDDGDPAEDGDARLAIRLEGSSDVVLLQLGEPTDVEDEFSVVFNIVDVGGAPSAVDFVRTDGGLRVAALVPSRQQAALVDPETTLSEIVALPEPFTLMRRVTADLGDEATGGDVALLWGVSSSIAFWSLGSSSGTPYRSISSTALSSPVSEVLDVPAPNQHLKVLRSSTTSDLYVLDLEKRLSFPFQSSLTRPTVSVSREGSQMWVYEPGDSNFSAVRLDALHPKQLTVQPGVSAVFDIAQKDGERAAVVLHMGASWDATWLDADDPDSTATAFFPALQLGGL